MDYVFGVYKSIPTAFVGSLNITPVIWEPCKEKGFRSGFLHVCRVSESTQLSRELKSDFPDPIPLAYLGAEGHMPNQTSPRTGQSALKNVLIFLLCIIRHTEKLSVLRWGSLCKCCIQLRAAFSTLLAYSRKANHIEQ